MKILFTADWHIKLNQKNVPKDWQLNRYRLLFIKIISTAVKEKADTIIIGGDIFDKTPTLEELSLFFEFCSAVASEAHDFHVLIYDGNHEATKKGQTFLPLLSDILGDLSKGRITIIDYATSYALFDILPYCRLHSDLKTLEPKAKILFTHVRGDIPPHVKAEVDLDLFNKWDLVIAGDLHAHSNSQRNILYPGSPLTTSFHREETSRGLLVIDTELLESRFIELDLPQMLRKSIKDEKDAIPTKYHHTVYELEGSVEELRTTATNTLVEKKVIKKEVTTKLDFTLMPLVNELHMYLTKIVNLSEDTLHKVMGLFNDYNKRD